MERLPISTRIAGPTPGTPITDRCFEAVPLRIHRLQTPPAWEKSPVTFDNCEPCPPGASSKCLRNRTALFREGFAPRLARSAH